jgi:Dimethlysulfonioproprionate lyase
MSDPAYLLSSPLGEPGSGRVRYGAAMALYQAGRICAAALEVYRIAAAHDGCDPRPMLAERGLAAPVPAEPEGGACLAALVAEADRYLARLPGDGPVEVRQGIARWTGPIRPQPGPSNPVVDAHLGVALASLAATHPALAGCIGDAVRHLTWVTYDLYPRAEIGEDFANGHAFASIIGGTGPMAAPDFDLGLFLIAPNVLYRDHCHRAPELYAPLTGPHGWRFGPDLPLTIKPAHQPVWNPPDQPHLTKVGRVPFLCLFGWTRDVNEPARVIQANDWPALEALRLG